MARQAKQMDLPEHRSEVRRLLSLAVRGGEIFFRGNAYQLAGGNSAGEAVRNTLGQLLPSIYPRFAEVPHRLVNEATAVKAALSGSATNADLQALGVHKADGTLNESHPLVSTLRLHLPLVEQDQPPVLAADLRDSFEKPPFGWDGNTIKVGLALLLRASACRLIDSGQIFADPSDPRAADLLSKEQSFKGLRVQGVRSEVTIPELMTIRGYLEASFNVRPPLVAASMSNALGEQLAGFAPRPRLAAMGRGCPVPSTVAFKSGTIVVEDLRGSATASVQLARYLEQADRLREYAELVEALGRFRRRAGRAVHPGARLLQQHGQRFGGPGAVAPPDRRLSDADQRAQHHDAGSLERAGAGAPRRTAGRDRSDRCLATGGAAASGWPGGHAAEDARARPACLRTRSYRRPQDSPSLYRPVKEPSQSFWARPC